jgi:hypothetical protein
MDFEEYRRAWVLGNSQSVTPLTPALSPWEREVTIAAVEKASLPMGEGQVRDSLFHKET